MSFVIDTSVVTRLRVPAVRQRVQALDGAGLALEAFELLEIDARHFVRARQVQRLLTVQGLKGRKVPDLLIAAVAEAKGGGVLHYDADFNLIASVTGQTSGGSIPRAPLTDGGAKGTAYGDLARSSSESAFFAPLHAHRRLDQMVGQVLAVRR